MPFSARVESVYSAIYKVALDELVDSNETFRDMQAATWSIANTNL